MKKQNKINFIYVWGIVSTLFISIVIVFMFIYIFTMGFKNLDLQFIFGDPKGSPLGSEGGVFPAILGTVYLTLISGIFSSILSICTAIYCKIYCKCNKLKAIIHLCVECIAGIPSIVLGLFGYSFLVLNLNLGRGLLSAGITLGIMIFPYIEIRVEKIFNEISDQLINSSYSLGISKSYTFFHLILPNNFKEVLSAITMGCGFAMGATSPILFTGAVLFAPNPKNLLSPVMALPTHLYMLLEEGISKTNAYGTTLILLLLVLIINLSSLFIGRVDKEEI